jgi:hypothetical protein
MATRAYLSDNSLPYATFEYQRGRPHTVGNSGLGLFEHLTVFPEEVFA